MNSPSDIQHIRALLTRYYDGLTTPDEEQELTAYFSRADEEVAADLLADARVIRAAALVAPDADSIELPDGLAERLDAVMQPAPKRSHGRRWWWGIGGAAAAAAIVWGVFALQPDVQPLGQPAPVKPAVAQTVPPALPEPEAAARETLSPASAKRQPKATKAAPAPRPSSALSDGYKEVTDPEEARRITEEIGRLLAANYEQTDAALEQVDRSFESYREITNNILQ